MIEYACCWQDGFCLTIKAKAIKDVSRKFPSANIYSISGPFESWIRYKPGAAYEQLDGSQGFSERST
jgi:hypothetical protein